MQDVQDRDGAKEVRTDQPVSVMPSSKWDNWRNLSGFWLLGLCNNFAYVVMLSAAYDILSQNSPSQNSTETNTTAFPPTGSPENRSGKLVPKCNTIGTGAILLADILPTLIIKLSAPLYMMSIPYSIRVFLVVGFAGASFPIVALSRAVWISILGVVCASLSSGFGEITFLSLSTHFDKNSVSTWSSGTGMAGVAGTLIYAGLIAIGLSARNTLFICITIPCILGLTYFFLLVKPTSLQPNSVTADSPGPEYQRILTNSDNEEQEERETTKNKEFKKLTWKERLLLILPLLKYMIPLAIVYAAEYFINQALFELIYFQHIWLSPAAQYRWYQVIYQIGVFLSRSSVNIFPVRQTWIFPILQCCNVVGLLLQVFFKYVPSIWIIFVWILFEGLMGGGAYVNTFYRISQEVALEYREFSMGVASLADSSGIALAGAVAIPVHNYICTL